MRLTISRRRARRGHGGIHRQRQGLGAFVTESLERRTLLSPFYDTQVIARPGQATAIGGQTIGGISGLVSINDSGAVAFTAGLTGGSALLTADGRSNPHVLSSLPNADRTYTFPQINNAGDVIVREQVPGGAPNSFIALYRAPDGTRNRVASNGGTYDSVLLPTLANDRGVAFVALTGGATQTGLYSNPTAQSGQEQFVTDLTGGGGLRPMLADGNNVLVRSGSGTTGKLLLNGAVLAETGATWTSLGSAPGISDDGTLVAFAGDRGNGPGVFLGVLDATHSSFSQIVTVAGETGAPGLHAELGFDNAGNALNLNAFDLDNRVGVARKDLGPAGLEGDSVVVAFVATPSAASRANPSLPGTPLLFSAAQGLWTAQVDFEKQLLAPNALVEHVKSPVPVVQLGDSVGGQVVTGFLLYDPIAVASTDDSGNPRTVHVGDHRLAFGVSTAAGEMVVRASQLDSDEDGLYDHWERAGGGIDMDQDGSIDLNLNAMGANPAQRDLFVEADWLTPRTRGGPVPWSNEPQPGVMQYLVNTFAAAPAVNGLPAGINVHVDAGSGRDQNGAYFSIGMKSGPLEGGDQIGQAGTGAHLDMVYYGLPGSVAVPGVQARAFSDIKDNFFGTADKRARELAFRYVVFADFFTFLTDALGNMVSGAVAGGGAATLTTAASLPALGGGRYAGHSVIITSGTGAGQVRDITGQPANNQLAVTPWAVVPDATSQFAVFNGSSGRGEADFYPSPDNYSIPGNDVVVTMGGFGVTPPAQGAARGVLGTVFDQSRTLVHELGHTLGLRHGGIDHNAHKGNNYLSLMNYDHQLSRRSPVNSYSSAGDPTFDDWSNLKLGFQNALIHVGNSFGLGRQGEVGDEQDPELTAEDMRLLNEDPIDADGPDLVVRAPAPGQAVRLGDAFAVEADASDPSAPVSVLVRFDADGDGDEFGPGEEVSAAPTSGASFRATFDGIAGPTGPRTFTVVAVDRFGNYTVARQSVQVTAGDPSGPEVHVSGNGVPIVDGAASASSADATRFPDAVPGGTAPQATFTVRNSGSTPLTLGAVTLPAGFTLVEPLAASLAPGDSDTFTVRLDTSAAGAFGGTASFATNDANENPFDFVLSGTVAAPTPEVEVRGNGLNIPNGLSSPSIFDNTRFGLAAQFTTGPTRVYTVRNAGAAPLALGPVTVPAGFTVAEPLAASLAPGASDTFTVRMDTSATARYRGVVSFVTNDADENPFRFTIDGSVAIAPGTLDLTFGGGDGKVTDPGGSQAHSIALQPDGKILLSGISARSAQYVVSRRLPDGSTDTSFGGGDGVASVDFDFHFIGAESQTVLLRPDGRIVVVGSYRDRFSNQIGLVQFTSDGSRDGSFGSAGIQIAFPGFNVVADAALQDDGKIVVGGWTQATSPDFAVARFNADGTPDLTFGGGDGLATLDTGPGDPAAADFGQAVVLQPDGKIVLLGYTGEGGGLFGVVRFNPDGTPDATFGGGDGLVTTSLQPLGYTVSNAADVAIEPDGKIVAVGNAVVRYKSDGQLDTTFGAGLGMAPIEFGGSDEGSAVAVQDDGNIVVAGEINGDFLLARFRPDGRPDQTFGVGGVTETDFAGKNDFGFALALQPDGKILIAGATAPNSSGLQFGLARFYGVPTVRPAVTVTATDPEGSEEGPGGRPEDLRFTVTRAGVTDAPLTVHFGLENDGGPGRATLGSDFTLSTGSFDVTIPAGSSSADIVVNPILDEVFEEDELVTLVLRDGPDYFVGLPFIADGVIHGEANRVALNGTPDADFGDGQGFVATDFGVGFTYSHSLAVAPDGKLYVAARVSLSENVGIARYRIDGTPDPSFDNDGLVITPLNILFGMRPSVAVQADGKVIAAGVFWNNGQSVHFGMARYLTDGSPDLSFGGGTGSVDTNFQAANSGYVNTIALQPDGKILLAGQADGDFALARYTPDGTLDPAFGAGGLVRTFINQGDSILGLALAPDGKIVAAGSTRFEAPTFTSSQATIVRYNADGSLDTTFGRTGIVVGHFEDRSEWRGVVVRPDGRVVVAGSAFISHPGVPSSAEGIVEQFNPDGTPDATFGGGDGVVLEHFVTRTAAETDTVAALVLQPDGKVIVVGNDSGDLVVARYTPEGVLDPTFGGGDGMVDDGRASSGDVGAALQPDGKLVFTVEGSFGGGGGNSGFTLSRLSGPLIGQSPRVTGVYVAGSNWTNTFRSYLASTGVGDAALGYRIPAASQLLSLPWLNLDRVSIRFDADVQVKRSDLLVSGVTSATYAFKDFTYDPATHTATWTMSAPAERERLVLKLASGADGVSLNGVPLDGEWNDGADAYPSGDRSAGGDFRFALNVLAGDLDRSGVVLANDYSDVKRKFFSSTTNPGSGPSGYSIFHDVNGSGSILADDYSEVKRRFFSRLPPAPTPAARPAAAPFSARRVATDVLGSV